MTDDRQRRLHVIAVDYVGLGSSELQDILHTLQCRTISEKFPRDISEYHG